MTFRRERYPQQWPAIRAGILLRANNRCDVFDAETGVRLGMERGSEYEARALVRVVLTVAHLDHDRTDNARRAREARRACKAAGTLPGME